MSAKLPTLEEAARTYESLLSQRAFQEGYAAYMAGKARTDVPPRLHVFSGNWIEGWLAASADAATQPGATPDTETHESRGYRIPLINNVESLLANRRVN